MRRLKVPGRLIGNKVPNSTHRYFYPIEGKRNDTRYRFMDDTDLPIVLPDINGNPQNPIVIMANHLRTLWQSPYANDTELKTRLAEDDIDIDGRGRDGLPVKPPILNKDYIRRLFITYLLAYGIGILADGKVVPQGRCYPYQTAWSIN